MLISRILFIVKCYTVGNVLIGIDLNSCEFHIEGKEIDKVALIHDDLFAFRGLDKKDLNNFFLVAEYVSLTER